MPNWCSCDLQVWGTNEQVNKVIDLLQGNTEQGAVDFNKVMPIPEGEDYDARWGTKWNACSVGTEWTWHSIDEEYSDAEISFETAWSPPIPVIDELLKLFPELKIELRYYECGMAYQGIKNNSGDVGLEYYGSRGG